MWTDEQLRDGYNQLTEGQQRLVDGFLSKLQGAKARHVGDRPPPAVKKARPPWLWIGGGALALLWLLR